MYRARDQDEDQRGPGEVVENDCQACKLNKEDAIHRTRCTWKLMRDQDGCEWVNASPGTSLPG